MNTETQHFIEKLKSDPNVLGIILFWSWARGNNRSWSDVDLVIIVNSWYRRIVEREGVIKYLRISTSLRKEHLIFGTLIVMTLGLIYLSDNGFTMLATNYSENLYAIHLFR